MEKETIIINNIHSGYGKLMGRFITDKDQEILAAIKARNEEAFPNYIFAELIEENYFNANIHPDMCSNKINCNISHLGTWNNTNYFQLTQLEIRYNEVDEQFYLFHPATNQKIYAFDLGFEEQKARSALFQFLSCFSPAQIPGIFLINEAVNEVLINTKEGIKILPRIIIDHTIILQRKTWVIDAGTIPLKEKNESWSSYFLGLNIWLSNNKIDRRAFIKIKTIDPSTATSSYSKPQYINFHSPSLVRLFAKMINIKHHAIYIAELIPDHEDAFKIDKEKYVAEYLIQVDNFKKP